MLTPGFIVAHSHRLEDLTALTVELLDRYPLPPLEQEVLLVQSNGIAQWLKQALARQTGIATMLEVSLPARLVWRLYRSVLGPDIPKQSPFDKQRLRWRILRLLPALVVADPDFKALAHYIAPVDKAAAQPGAAAHQLQTTIDEQQSSQAGPDQRKLFQLSDKLADLFDQYQVYRADWLDSWGRGELVLAQSGQAIPLPDEQRWQAKLWQALVQDIGAEQICSNRAALHQRFLSAAASLTAQQRPDGVPPRIVVFGISSLPRQTLEVLHALKGLCQIVLCVHNPCQYHWADIIAGRDLLRQYAKPRFRSKNQSSGSLLLSELHQYAPPLLASWGKQGRDYIRLLDEFDETAAKAAAFSNLRFDLFDEAEPTHLLGRLQHDILHLRPNQESQQHWPAPDPLTDKSIVFQRCHSALREVEVLHDHLLAAFDTDPSLQPRDIMVMVPDINSYAPYITAVFGRLAADDPRYIPYTLADQGQRQRNPLLQALELILQAPTQRFSHSELFDLLQVPALRRRFALSEQQVSQLQQWAAAAGARWGLDATQRQGLGLSYSWQQNSWQFALNRLLYGYAAGATAASWQDIAAYAEVSALEAQAIGALAALVETLQHCWQQLQAERSPANWHQLLSNLLDQLFTADNEQEMLLLARLRDTLDDWLQSTQEAQFDAVLPIGIVAELWLASVDEPNLQQRFMAGSVNFATLMPMRAIPFQRICLLGMNEGDYPRQSPKTDFDLMRLHYRPGDRSRREDDRYLFLEALLSARQQLYISWVGASAQDNSELPPSVLVGQLQDQLNALWPAPAGSPTLAERLTTAHKLQPFAPAYFAAEPDSPYFSYAKEWLSIHQDSDKSPLKRVTGLSGGAVRVTGGKAEPLAPFQAEAPFSLLDLQLLLKEPAQLLARRRLGVYLQSTPEALPDVEPFALNGLAVWQVKHQLLTALLAEQPQNDEQALTLLRQQQQRLKQAGDLPYGAAAAPDLARTEQTVLALYQARSALVQQSTPLAAKTYQLQLGDVLLEAELNTLYATPEAMLQLELTASKVVEVKPRSVSYQWRNLVTGYLKHLVACTVLQQAPSTVILGADGFLTLAPLNASQARAELEQLAAWLQQALRQPLPLALELAADWYKAEQKQEEYSPSKLAGRYHGNAYQEGVRADTPYLARYYPQAQQLFDAGFSDWVAYYRPFFQQLQAATAQPLSALVASLGALDQNSADITAEAQP